MCGIAGVFHRSGRPAEHRELEVLLDSMVRRGPDGSGRHLSGALAMGMRRLAILDVAHGQQPFFDESGRVAVVMNGEIYNFRSLRRDLEARGVEFRTRCDAETLPHAYAHFGVEGMLERIDGMFAIAIHDGERNVLHLLRDRFGEKPLFYSDRAGCFAFASQLSTLRLLPQVRSAIDPTALDDFLAMHFVAGPRTVFADARRVPPGHRLELALTGSATPTVRRWWHPLAGTDAGGRRGPRVRAAGLRRALEHAVGSRLVSDVPVGVFLSGGVDSSAVAATAAAVGGRVRTFSIGFEDADLDESEHARHVASTIGADHHHFAFDLGACLDSLDPALGAAGEPLGDPAALPLFLLSREASRHVKVVLSGEGADEIFAGYGYYPGAGAPGWRERLRRLGREGGPAARPEGFYGPGFTTPSGFPLLTTPGERAELVQGEADRDDPWLAGIAGRCQDTPCRLRAAQLADVETWLADDLLPKLDRMTMAASIEGRAPFLEPGVAGIGLGAGAGSKVGRRGTKLLLRRAAAGLLPSRIRSRPKQGFVLPMQRWLTGPLRERLLDELSGDRGDGLEWKRARDLAERDLAEGAPRSRLLYALLAYRIWSGSAVAAPGDAAGAQP